MTEQATKPTIAEQVAALRERAASLISKANELEAKEANAAALASVGVGYTVSFKQGRAETRRDVSGQVLFRGEVDGVDVVRVITGEGASVAIVQVKVSDLLSASAPAEAAPEPQAEATDVDALVEGTVQIG